MFKGETFFTAANRKCKDETGLDGEALQVLGVYNTHFSTSNWDLPDKKGTQTVNAAVLVIVKEGSEVMLDQTSSRFRWCGIDPDKEPTSLEDKYVVSVLRRLKAWNKNFIKAKA